MRKSLYVVRDATGKQWLCPSRPRLLGEYPRQHWEIPTLLSKSVAISRDVGCIPLSAGNGPDRSCFEGKLAWRVYGVGISL